MTVLSPADPVEASVCLRVLVERGGPGYLRLGKAGEAVIDLAFGNPDIPSPDIAVEKLAEAASMAKNHRYSLSRGLPKLREAAAARSHATTS